MGYACGRGARIELNRCYLQADLANDGACIQIRSGAATGTTLAHNWASDSVKGFRLDSGSNSAFCPSEINNTIVGNVAMWTNGFMLKNDYNTYANNLALWPPRSAVHGSRASHVLRVDTTRYKGENGHSIVKGNVATSWSPNALPGVMDKTHPNVLDGAVWQQLRDPEHYDFRPREGSIVAQSGAGPYGLGAQYWIPGRREWRASSPIPPNGVSGADALLDIMFLGALGYDRHEVFFGASPKALKSIAILEHESNVQNVTSGNSPLPAGSTWWWRVDAVDSEGNLAAPGEVWSFTVRKTHTEISV